MTLRRLIAAVICATVACALPAMPAAAAPEKVRAVGDTAPLGSELLSDEQTVTRWASAHQAARIRARPSGRARTVARLRFRTEDGPSEVYVVLRSHVDAVRRTWLQVRVPMRPNGRKGWVLRAALGPLQVVRTKLLVNRRTLRATLYRAGRPIWRSRIGVGTPRTPTPRGHFWIRTRLRNLGGGGVYGPWAFGTAAYSVLSDWPGGGVIGIHGTNQPGLIPGRPSHGCIRVPNGNIRKLVRRMPIGTPVEIR
jgi:L,D-transpeptidase catalytic domain